MKYEIVTTNIFDKWLAMVKDFRHRARIISRFDHIQLGNFGDHKKLGENLFELRFFFGPDFRIYYTIKGVKGRSFALWWRQVHPKQRYKKSKNHYRRTEVNRDENNHQEMGYQRISGQP